MDTDAPSVIVLAGPNGAGKSTISLQLLPTLGVCHFVNADVIARGLSGFRSEDMAIKAGRIMLEHLKDLARERATFAFETTLASRTFASWIADLKQGGYLFHLFYLWLPTADMSVQRVRDRVRRGGHDVPEETIRRRYGRGLENFFRLYQPLADNWRLMDNTRPRKPRLIAEGNGKMITVKDSCLWQELKREYGHEGTE